MCTPKFEKPALDQQGLQDGLWRSPDVCLQVGTNTSPGRTWDRRRASCWPHPSDQVSDSKASHPQGRKDAKWVSLSCHSGAHQGHPVWTHVSIRVSPNPFTHPCPRTPLLSLYSPLQLTILPSTHSPGRNLDVVFKPSYHHFISISSNQPPHPDLTPSKHCLDFLILCCPKFLQLWLGWLLEWLTGWLMSCLLFHSASFNLNITFRMMLPIAHLTSYSMMSGSRWVITPSWLSGSCTKLVEFMEFQLSYFKYWKMMLWKCCIQYASKFGNSPVAIGLEKVSIHSNPKESQCQRMLKLLHSCTHFTHWQSNSQNSPSQAWKVCEPWTSRCLSWI